MAKEKAMDADRAARKAEKKARKEGKRSEAEGVHKSTKEKKITNTAIASDAQTLHTKEKISEAVEHGGQGTELMELDDEVTLAVRLKPLQGALVPFAHPLADERQAKRIFKTVKKANKVSALRRGVKEVVKSLRQSPIPAPSSSAVPPYVCAFAADISPMDVISHLPVLCEEHGIPYIFVTSRAELGAAGGAKRPTSTILLSKEAGKRKKDVSKDGDGQDEKPIDWPELYGEILKTVQQATHGVRI